MSGLASEPSPSSAVQPGAAEIHHEHRDVSGGWLRPTVFGITDGLVSNAALIAGVAGANTSVRAITLAGLAGLVGGAFSMAAGEYVSVRSQNESTAAEIEVERHELRVNADGEIRELAELYEQRGVEPELAFRVAEQLSRDPDSALDVHAREELGVDPHDLPSPWTAAISSFLSFTVGALVPLIPYLFGASALALSLLLALLALFAAGAVTARFTTRAWWYMGARQMLLGLGAAAITYAVGVAFGASVG